MIARQKQMAMTASNYTNKDTKNVSKPSYRNDYVKMDSNTSGLRPGFVRDTKPDFTNKQGNRNYRAAEPQNNTNRAPPMGQDAPLTINQNLKNEDINKEGKTVADNTIHTEVIIAKTSETIEVAKTNKDTSIESTESKIIEKSEPVAMR